MTALTLTASLSAENASAYAQISPTPTVAAKPAAQPVSERPDRVSAALSARLQGSRVLVSSETTESTLIYANPDGTITLEASSGPVRVKQGEKWTPIDTTLVAADGVFKPKASLADVEFSAGGEGKPLARLKRSDKEFYALSWPTALPQPKIEGSKATYADAAGPGADLVVTALPDGFRHDVVLRERPAGPIEYTIPVQTQGLTLSQTEEGGLKLTDGKGKTVAAAPEPFMVDSSAVADNASTPSGAPSVDGAAKTGKVGEVTTSVELKDGTTVLALKPDERFLADPATEYPVTVDPTTTLSAISTAQVYSSGEVYDGPFTAGTIDPATDGWKGRSYLKFDTSSLAGQTVTDARLELWRTYVVGCEDPAASGVEIRQVTSSWNRTAISWPSQPTSTSQDSVIDPVADPDTYECDRKVGLRSLRVTPIVQHWAAGTANHGFVMQGKDETQQLNYNSYSIGTDGNPGPKLSVTFGSTPATDRLSVFPGAMADSIQYATSTTPILRAWVNDPDSASVRADFEVEHDPAAANQGTGLIWSGSVDNIPAGTEAKIAVPAGKLQDGWKIRWRARASDASSSSMWSTWQRATIDAEAPVLPVIECETYPVNTWSARVKDAYCTARTDSADGTGYFWGLDDPTTPNLQAWQGSGDNTMALPLDLPDGWHTLYVRARDKAHNRSALASYSLGIGPGGFISPVDKARVQRTVALSVSAPPGRTEVRYYYRPVGDVFNLYEIPPGDVTVPGSSTPLTAWPQTRTDTSKDFPALTWNMAKTLADAKIRDGQIEVSAYLFGGGKPEEFIKDAVVTMDRSGFGGSYATHEIGPGTVALQTGDYAVEAADASLFGISINRTLTTLAPGTERPDEQLPENKVFGPGWRAGFPSAPSGIADFSPTSGGESGSLQLVGADGSTLSYHKDGTSFTGIGDAADGSRITATAEQLTVTDSSGAKTSYVKAYGNWVVARTETPAAESAVTYYRDAQGRVTRVLAPVAADITCGTTLAPGCRALELSYASATTATGVANGWGDFSGQVKSVSFTAFDPESNAMKTTVLAAYQYDSTGHLRQVTDPRTNLATVYYYNGEGRISQITPPGLAPWRMDYDKAGRLAHVQREGGDVDPTQAVAYDVPIGGAGAPIDLTLTQTAKWGQATDLPVSGTAIFPASHLPARNADGAYTPVAADWEYAGLIYTDVNGRGVNTAAYGAGAWQISATRYDDKGNTTWELSPGNRAQALTPTVDTDPYVAGRADSAERASLLATIRTYNSDSDPLTATEPARQVQLADGSLISARKLTTTSYDEGKPSQAVTYHLATTTKVEPLVLDGTATPAPTDVRTVKTGYDPITSGDASGWQLRQPTSTTTVMPGQTDLVRKTRYDAAAREIERRQPASTGSDAGSLATAYYTAGAHPQIAGCGNKPHWAGLACRRAPITQPTGKPLPVATLGYGYYGGLTSSVETAGAATRITTVTFDAAGRLSTTKVEVTPASESGTAVPESTVSYDPATGLRAGVSAAGNTLTNGYDSFGRLATTKDADSNTTTITYTLDGQLASTTDAKGSVTYTYDGTDATGAKERRGLPTAITAQRIGTFTGAYTGDGQLAAQGYPNGLRAVNRYDSVGFHTGLAYAKDGTPWLSYSDVSDIHGKVTQSGDSQSSSQRYTYDGAGRLAKTADSANGSCTTRQYTLDANSNRKKLETFPSDAGGGCSTGTTPVTKAASFDAADRITNSGYVYDAFGRTTTVPAADVTGGADLSVGYHANDMVASLTQNGTTKTYGLDPRGRIRTINTTTGTGSFGTIVNHYAGGSDSPSWVAESDGSWSRNITAFTGLAAIERSNGTSQIKLTNLHGDIVATCDNSPASGIAAYHGYTEYGPAKAGSNDPGRYGWLGAHQRSSGDSLGGLILMGARLYNPATGRFLQVDPLLGGSDNPYEYASQDPINNLDLDGTKKAAKKKSDPKAKKPGPKSWEKCEFTWYGRKCTGFITSADVDDLIHTLNQIAAGAAGCAAGSVGKGWIGTVVGAVCGATSAGVYALINEIDYANKKSGGKGVDYTCKYFITGGSSCGFKPHADPPMEA
ncbi:DNRLRE domain-containing protein [Nonomuraea sp. NPDC049637]|uniref:DNRLRE domain-containing protein n=1 Tax=Nonomuraea sp. NPDC049637 TaxID=3154356 RepID=UPI0034416294